MNGERRKYRREGEERRREALIAAALDLIGEGGPRAATVRAIADRADVTPGLIRHYFAGKDDLTRAAFEALMDRLTSTNMAVLAAAGDDPATRLAAVVAAALRPPVSGPKEVSLWAGFINTTLGDAAMRETHRRKYLAYRDQIEDLIAALPRPDTPVPEGEEPALCRQSAAIACNAVIDGLWLEGSMLPEDFADDRLARIGVRAVAAILGVELVCPPPPADATPFLPGPSQPFTSLARPSLTDLAMRGPAAAGSTAPGSTVPGSARNTPSAESGRARPPAPSLPSEDT